MKDCVFLNIEFNVNFNSLVIIHITMASSLLNSNRTKLFSSFALFFAVLFFCKRKWREKYYVLFETAGNLYESAGKLAKSAGK